MEPFTQRERGQNAARAPLWLVKHPHACKKVLWDIAFNAHLHLHRVKRIPLRGVCPQCKRGRGHHPRRVKGSYTTTTFFTILTNKTLSNLTYQARGAKDPPHRPCTTYQRGKGEVVVRLMNAKRKSTHLFTYFL